MCWKNTTDDALAAIMPLPELQSLQLCYSRRLTDDGLTHLQALPKLQHLALRGCLEVTDAGLEHLKSLSTLQRLDIISWYSRLTDNGLVHVAALGQLKSLSLGGTITDAGLEPLKCLKSLEKIKFIDCPGVTGSGLEHLRGIALKFIKMKRIFPGTQVCLSALQHFPGLRELALIDMNMTDDDMAHCRHLTSLKLLDLSNSRSITGAGLCHLAQCRSTLEVLDLTNCSAITDTALVEIKRLTVLRELSLSCDGRYGFGIVTDEGFSHLHGLTALRSLFLNGQNFINDYGLRRFTCYNFAADPGAHRSIIKRDYY